MKKTISSRKERFFFPDNPFVSPVLKHAPRYAGVSLISGIVGVLMAKYYTFVFSPAQFGVLALYITLYRYMRNVIAFTVDASCHRVYFEYRDKERPEFFGTVLIFISLGALGWFTASLFLRDFVVSHFGGDNTIYIITILVAIVAVYANFFERIGYDEHQSRLVFRQGLLHTLLNHGGSYLLIGLLKLGILGRQLGQMIAHAANAGFYMQALIRSGYVRLRPIFRIDIMRKVLHFAIPSFSTTVLVATFSYLDRIFLNYFHGAREVGIYSLAFMIGVGVNIIVEAVSMALFPSVMKELARDYMTNIRKLKQFDIVFCGGLVVIGVLIYVARDLIIALLSNRNYYQAASVLPFIAFGYVLGGFYKNVSNVLAFHNVVWFYPGLSVVSYGANAILNFTLIPRYHEVGAAYASFVGMFIYSLVIHLIARKYFYKTHTIVIIYGAIFFIVTYIFMRSSAMM